MARSAGRSKARGTGAGRRRTNRSASPRGTGRREAVRRRWARRLALFEQSGLSQVRFCSRLGLPLSSFQYWKRRLGTSPAARAGTGSSEGHRAGAQLPEKLHEGSKSRGKLQTGAKPPRKPRAGANPSRELRAGMKTSVKLRAGAKSPVGVRPGAKPSLDRSVSSDRGVSFLPVRVVSGARGAATILPAPGVSTVEILLRGGRTLRAASNLDPQTLARLADALEGRPC